MVQAFNYIYVGGQFWGLNNKYPFGYSFHKQGIKKLSVICLVFFRKAEEWNEVAIYGQFREHFI